MIARTSNVAACPTAASTTIPSTCTALRQHSWCQLPAGTVDDHTFVWDSIRNSVRCSPAFSQGNGPNDGHRPRRTRFEEKDLRKGQLRHLLDETGRRQLEGDRGHHCGRTRRAGTHRHKETGGGEKKMTAGGGQVIWCYERSSAVSSMSIRCPIIMQCM